MSRLYSLLCPSFSAFFYIFVFPFSYTFLWLLLSFSVHPCHYFVFYPTFFLSCFDFFCTSFLPLIVSILPCLACLTYSCPFYPSLNPSFCSVFSLFIFPFLLFLVFYCTSSLYFPFFLPCFHSFVSFLFYSRFFVSFSPSCHNFNCEL